MNAEHPHVGLFVTCLVDSMRPSVGFAAIKLLEQAGCRVTVPRRQTCCGQPAYNSGDRADAAAIARSVVDVFEEFDFVVAPSGSCAGMLRCHYPALLADAAGYGVRAAALAEKSWELVSFLVDFMKMDGVDSAFSGTATYHDSCAGLRELGVREQPRSLLKTVRGLSVSELPDADVCCGFGGTFCVKYPPVSGRMVSAKIADITATGADIVLAGDLGCLLNIAGRLSRTGGSVRARHVAEVLAGMTDGPAIGEDGP
ncbi:MAG: (Fe-S)-binding protein [Alphaproteobacteria bacterium]